MVRPPCGKLQAQQRPSRRGEGAADRMPVQPMNSTARGYGGLRLTPRAARFPRARLNCGPQVDAGGGGRRKGERTSGGEQEKAHSFDCLHWRRHGAGEDRKGGVPGTMSLFKAACDP